MKSAVIVFLLIAVTALVYVGRHSSEPATPAPPPPVKAAANTVAVNAGVALETSQAAQPPATEENWVQQLCLPGTLALAQYGSGIGMNNIPETVAEFEAGLAGLKQKLAVSNDPEHLLTAAFLSDSADERLALAKRALRTMPNDPNLLHRAIGFCLEVRDASLCPLTKWEAQLLGVDSQNSESWMLVATNRYARGDHDAALDALQHAAAASDTRRYVPETIMLIKRSLAAASDLPDHMQYLDATGIAAAIRPDDRRLAMCERASGSDDWLDACLRYGRLAERQGILLTTRAIGLAIQRRTLEAMNDVDGLAAVSSRTGALSAQSLSQEDWQSARMLILQAEPGVQRSFLETWAQSGETAANALLDDEINRRLDTDERIDCTGL